MRRPIGRLGITSSAEVFGDLSVWSSALLVGSPVNNGDGTELLTYRDATPVNQSGERFIRLKVHQ
jgi:hypothetical protein